MFMRTKNTGTTPELAQHRQNEDAVLSDFVHAILDQPQRQQEDRQHFSVGDRAHSSLKDTLERIRTTKAHLKALVLENQKLRRVRSFPSSFSPHKSSREEARSSV